MSKSLNRFANYKTIKRLIRLISSCNVSALVRISSYLHYYWEISICNSGSKLAIYVNRVFRAIENYKLTIQPIVLHSQGVMVKDVKFLWNTIVLWMCVAIHLYFNWPWKSFTSTHLFGRSAKEQHTTKLMTWGKINLFSPFPAELK